MPEHPEYEDVPYVEPASLAPSDFVTTDLVLATDAAGNPKLGRPGTGPFVGPQGDTGADGKSAYQVWLDAGNAGTEQAFFDSIKHHYATIAQMKAVTSLSDGVFVLVAEKFRGGYFLYHTTGRSAGSFPAVEGIYFDGAGADDYFERVYSGPVKPEMWGATGTGLVDDHAAVAAAFTSGRNVAFQHGHNYLISTLTPLVVSSDNQIIDGNGATLTVSELWANDDCLEITGNNVIVRDLSLVESNASAVHATKAAQALNVGVRVDGSDMRLDNVKVVGFGFPLKADTANADGLQINNCDFSYGASWVEIDSVKRVVISNSHAHHMGLDGWKIQNGQTRTTDGFRMTSCTGHANGQRDSNAAGGESSNGNGIDVYNGGKLCVLTNCRFYGNYGAGFNIKGTAQGSPAQPHGEVTLIGCTAEGNQATSGGTTAGFEINTGGDTAGSFVRLIGCSSVENSGRGIAFYGGYGHTVTDCQVRGNGGVGIDINDDCYDISIKGGAVVDNVTATGAIMIGNSDAGTHVSRRIRISDAILSGNYDHDTASGFDPKNATTTKNTGYGIRVYSDTADVSIERCSFYNFSSGNGNVYTKGRDVCVRGCYFWDAITVAVACYSPGSDWETSTSYDADDIAVSDDKIYKATTTDTSGATAPTHSSGTVSDGGVDWLYLSQVPSTTIENCHIEETDYTSTSGAGIWIYDNHDVTMKGNRFTQSTSTTNAFAIKVRSGATGTYDYPECLNVGFISNSSDAFNSPVFYRNIDADLEDLSPSVEGVRKIRIDNTTGGNISDFGDSVDGQPLTVLIRDGVTGIADGSSVDLYGTSYAASAGGAAFEFVRDGTQWVCVSRTDQ